jgi:hypothetical protein
VKARSVRSRRRSLPLAARLRNATSALRVATSAYQNALRDALPGLERICAALARQENEGWATRLEDVAALLECAKAALEVDDAPGTAASLAALLERLERL